MHETYKIFRNVLVVVVEVVVVVVVMSVAVAVSLTSWGTTAATRFPRLQIR